MEKKKYRLCIVKEIEKLLLNICVPKNEKYFIYCWISVATAQKEEIDGWER